MSLKDIILIIASKSKTTKLCGLEKSIFDEYVNNITLALTNNNPVLLDTICENIKTKLLNDNTTIIKLLFKNDQYIFVDKSLLMTIEYFKIMLEDCNTNNDVIVDIVVNNNIDNYFLMNDIMIFLTTQHYAIYDNLKYTFDMLILLDYIDYNEMLQNIGKNITAPICVIPLDKIEKVYTILTKNKIDTKFNIEDVWLAHIENNVITDDVFEMAFFKDVILKTDIGKQLVLDHKYIKHYMTILDHNNYKIIIEELLKIDTIESYGILLSIKNDYVWKYLKDDIDKFDEKIFNFDISVLDNSIIADLCIKYDKIDLINKYFKNIMANFSTKLYLAKILRYAIKYNNNKNDVDLFIYNMDEYYRCDVFASIYPAIRHNYKSLGYTGKIITLDNDTKEFTSCITIQSNIIITKQSPIGYIFNNKMCMLSINQIALPYIKDDITHYHICEEIFGGLNTYEQSYKFIVDNNKLNDGQRLYITQ